jgi:hypothetical protein
MTKIFVQLPQFNALTDICSTSNVSLNFVNYSNKNRRTGGETLGERENRMIKLQE